MKQHKPIFIYVLFWLLIVALPLSKAVASIAEVILFFIAIAELLQNLKNLQFKKINILLPSILFFLFLISGIYSENKIIYLKEIRAHLPLLFIPFSVWILQSYISKKKESLFLAFICSTFLSFICTIIYTYLPLNIIEKTTGYSSLLMPHPMNSPGMFGMASAFIDRIQLSNLIGIATLLSIYLGFKRKHSIFILTTLLLFISSMLLGGRGGQIALFIALIFILSITITQKLAGYWLIKKTSFTIPLIIISTILFGIFYLSIHHIPLIKERYNQNSYELKMFKSKTYKDNDLEHYTTIRRLISWNNSKILLKNAIWFGTGIGDYDIELQKIYDKDLYKLPINHHNQYLFIFGSIGVIFGGIYLLSIFYASYLFSKHKEMFSIGVGFLVFYMVAFIPDAVLLKQIDCMSYALFFSVFISKT